VAPASFAAVCQPAAASVAAVIPNTCMNLNGNAGRNELVGPGLQFRVAMFNILNRANFQSPLDSTYLLNQNGTPVSGAGFTDSTSTPSREIQLGLKIIL
jgi:hypothetical protein